MLYVIPDIFFVKHFSDQYLFFLRYKRFPEILSQNWSFYYEQTKYVKWREDSS